MFLEVRLSFSNTLRTDIEIMKAGNYRSSFKIDSSDRDFNSNSRRSSLRVRPEIFSIGSRPTSQSFSQLQVPTYSDTPGTSTDNLVSYGFVADKVSQQCTILTYPGDPVTDPVYPNYQVTLPPSITPFNGMDSLRDRNIGCNPVHLYPPGNDISSKGNERLILDKYQNDCDEETGGNSSSNDKCGMSSDDKISKWIDSLPIFEVGDNKWKSGCYHSDFSPNWEEVEPENQ